MGIQIIAKPVDGLPFVNLDGHPIEEFCRNARLVVRTLKATKLHLHPVQFAAFSAVCDRDIELVSDTRDLPTVGTFRNDEDVVVGHLYGLTIPTSLSAADAQGLDLHAAQKLSSTLEGEAATLERYAEALRQRSKALKSQSAEVLNEGPEPR